jgi:hypothetical protein
LSSKLPNLLIKRSRNHAPLCSRDSFHFGHSGSHCAEACKFTTRTFVHEGLVSVIPDHIVRRHASVLQPRVVDAHPRLSSRPHGCNAAPCYDDLRDRIDCSQGLIFDDRRFSSLAFDVWVLEVGVFATKILLKGLEPGFFSVQALQVGIGGGQCPGPTGWYWGTHILLEPPHLSINVVCIHAHLHLVDPELTIEQKVRKHRGTCHVHIYTFIHAGPPPRWSGNDNRTKSQKTRGHSWILVVK